MCKWRSRRCHHEHVGLSWCDVTTDMWDSPDVMSLWTWTLMMWSHHKHVVLSWSHDTWQLHSTLRRPDRVSSRQEELSHLLMFSSVSHLFWDELLWSEKTEPFFNYSEFVLTEWSSPLPEITHSFAFPLQCRRIFYGHVVWRPALRVAL